MGTGRALVAQPKTVWPPPWLRWLPPLFIAVAVVLELLVPPRYFFGSLLSASVLLGAMAYPPLGTAVTGLVCVGVLWLLDLLAPREYDQHLSGSLVTLCVVTLLVTVLTVARVRTARQLSQVRAVAQAAQLALLRPLPERIGPVRMAGCYQAATDEALIGGDLYGVRRTPYGLRVLVGDVRGKGIGATGTVATILASFREAAMVSPDLPAVADRIEAALALDREDALSGMFSGMGRVTGPLGPPLDGERPPPAPGRPAAGGLDTGGLDTGGLDTGRPDRPDPGGPGADGPGAGTPEDPGSLLAVDELFATAVLMEFPEGEDTVRVLDRGHPPLLRLGPDEVTPLEPHEEEYGMPLGLGDLAPGEQRVRSFGLPPGRMLVAYSDGVTEARDKDGEFYPLERRLRAHFTDAYPEASADWDAERPTTPAEVVTFLQYDVNRWAPTLNDDLVVVALQRTAEPAPAPTPAPSGDGDTDADTGSPPDERR